MLARPSLEIHKREIRSASPPRSRTGQQGGTSSNHQKEEIRMSPAVRMEQHANASYSASGQGTHREKERVKGPVIRYRFTFAKWESPIARTGSQRSCSCHNILTYLSRLFIEFHADLTALGFDHHRLIVRSVTIGSMTFKKKFQLQFVHKIMSKLHTMHIFYVKNS